MAAESLKLGRGSDASGGGRRAVTAPNMHSLATAAVSGCAAQPGPRTPPQSCVSASSPSSLCGAWSPAPALDTRGPGPPPRRALVAVKPPATFLAHRRLWPLAPHFAFFSGPGAWSRARNASLAARTGHSLIHCPDQQFPAASCVLGVGGDEGNSVINLTRPWALGTDRLGTSQRKGNGF